MSATQATETYSCAYCGGTRSLTETVEGSYCSERCYYREKGEGAMNRVESHSRFCDSCYAPVRDVEPIPDRVRPDADGFQYRTPNTTIGVDDIGRDRYDRLERTRWSCGNCGAVDPDGGPIAECQNAALGEAIGNLFRALNWLYEREAIPERPGWDAYVEALRAYPRDAAFAVGKSVYAHE